MWIQGTILNICGSVLVNLAANLLKLSHNVDENEKNLTSAQNSTPALNDAVSYGSSRQNCLQGPFVCSSKHYWRLGAFLFATGSIINFFSLSMAAQSLLATLGGVQFVSNIFFAGCILGERITKRGLVATGVIVLGLTVAVSFSDHKSTRYNASGLIALYDSTYITFIACVIISISVAECTYLLYTAREKAGEPLIFSSIIRPVAYSMVSATVGTQSVLQSKCLAELLRTDAAIDKDTGNDLFANALFYIVLTAFILGMAFWLYRLNNALKLFDGLVIIPIIQVFWVTSAVLQGGMFFKEFQEMSGRQSILFSTGVVTVFFGVYLIATSQSNSKRDCESDNQHLHCQNGESSSDRLTDLEKCDDKVIEFTRKRADSTVMIMTCIGSPVEIGEGRSSRKMGARNQNHSNSSSCKSSSYDGCDRYVGEISQNKGLYEDENDSVRGLSELVGVGGGDGEGEGDGKGENDSRISLTSKNASSSEKSSLLSAQNKILSKQLQSQLQSQSIPCTMLSIKNPLQATSSPESIFFTTKTPILSNNSSNSEATNTLDCLPPNSGNKILSKDTFLPIHDPISSTRTEGSHPKASGLRSLLPAIISPMLRIRSESACGLLESDEDVAS